MNILEATNYFLESVDPVQATVPFGELLSWSESGASSDPIESLVSALQDAVEVSEAGVRGSVLSRPTNVGRGHPDDWHDDEYDEYEEDAEPIRGTLTVTDIPEGAEGLEDIGTALGDHIETSCLENISNEYEYDVVVLYADGAYGITVSKYEDAQKKTDRLKDEY